MPDNQEFDRNLVQEVQPSGNEQRRADGLCQEDGAAPSSQPPAQTSAHEPTELSAGLAHLRALLERQDLTSARAWVDRLRQRWPDSNRVQHFSRILARPAIALQRGRPKSSRREEYRWLRDHAGEYPGCWLAVLGYDLIAADPDFAVVLAAVRKLEKPDEALLHFQPRPSP